MPVCDLMVPAATVVVQGAVLSRLDAFGPELPAAVATKTPAVAALRNATCTGLSYVLSNVPPTK